jgi:hypothetical protein
LIQVHVPIADGRLFKNDDDQPLQPAAGPDAGWRPRVSRVLADAAVHRRRRMPGCVLSGARTAFIDAFAICNWNSGCCPTLINRKLQIANRKSTSFTTPPHPAPSLPPTTPRCEWFSPAHRGGGTCRRCSSCSRRRCRPGYRRRWRRCIASCPPRLRR